MSNTVDFGASDQYGAHHFYVSIPGGPKDAVTIFEDYGFDGDSNKRETEECRVLLARELWNQIKEESRKQFNERLKIQKLSTGSWKVGKNKLDRFLGRELCVLAWAVEPATPDECLVIVQKWLALRPEERWWLYAKTASEAGKAEQTHRGWRKALYCALSDGEGIRVTQKVAPKKKEKKGDELSLDLLGMLGEQE